MLLPLSLILSLATPSAQARCVLAALETDVSAPSQVGVVDAAPEVLVRRDRWTWRVEGGSPDCTAVHLASPSAAPILGVQARIERQDARSPKLEGLRRVHVATSADPGFGASAGLVLLVPEVAEGDLLVVDVRRPAWLEQGVLVWRPGARGPLELATLTTPPGLVVRAEGVVLPDTPGDWQVEAVSGGGPEPLDDGPEAPVPQAVVELTQAMLLPQRKPVRGLSDPELGATVTVIDRLGGLPRRVARPADALSSWCTVDGLSCATVGEVAWQLPADGIAAWGWVRPGAVASGELLLRGHGPQSSILATLLFPTQGVATQADPGVDLSLSAPMAGWTDLLPAEAAAMVHAAAPLTQAVTVQASDLAAATPEGLPHPRLGWRLTHLDDRPVLDSVAAAQQAVAWLAVRASMPEPSLPSELRGRKTDPSAIPELLALHHERLHSGMLADSQDLAPRKLMAVRRSGWGTPWEQALVLTRYLNQLKLDALPVPLRPLASGAPDPASLHSWPLALVRVDVDGQPLWLDPTCSTCPLGGLRPDFDGAVVLSADVTAGPELRPSAVHREVVKGAGGTAVTVNIDGPLALELRARLARQPVEERATWLAWTLLGTAAELSSHDGLVDGSQALVLTFTGGPELEPRAPLMAPSASGEPQVLLPARGVYTERRVFHGQELPSLSSATRWLGAESDGLVWRRDLSHSPAGLVLQERLEVRSRVLDRAPAAALLGRVSRAWGQLPPAPAPLPELPPAPAPPE